MRVTIQRTTVLVFLLIVSVCGPAFGLHNHIPNPPRRGTRHSRLRRVLWNPLFRPSRESLVRQNEEIDRLDLPRIQDDTELEQLKASQELVPIVAGDALR